MTSETTAGKSWAELDAEAGIVTPTLAERLGDLWTRHPSLLTHAEISDLVSEAGVLDAAGLKALTATIGLPANLPGGRRGRLALLNRRLAGRIAPLPPIGD